MNAPNTNINLETIPSPKKSNRIGIIGAGNVLMGDDGVGIAVLELLKNEAIPENISIIDAGTGGLSLLHALAKLESAIIVDAVDFGGAPGETRRFTPEDASTMKVCPGVSTHESDLLKILKLSDNLGECPETVIIYAIQPSNVSPSMELSQSIKTKLPEIVEDILETIRSITSCQQNNHVP